MNNEELDISNWSKDQYDEWRRDTIQDVAVAASLDCDSEDKQYEKAALRAMIAVKEWREANPYPGEFK